MKIGYSVLLAEFVEAKILDYTDCKEFQIVCPECKEPLFKKVKTIDEIQSHFLSHYNVKESNKDCEQRVASYSYEKITHHNFIARGQNLEKFCDHIPALVIRASTTHEVNSPEFKECFKGYNLADVTPEALSKSIMESSVVSDFVKRMADYFVSPGNEGLDMFLNNEHTKSGLALETRIRIANSLMEYFKTPKGRSILEYSLSLVITTSAVINKYFRFLGTDDSTPFFDLSEVITFGGPLKRRIVFEKINKRNDVIKAMMSVGTVMLYTILIDEPSYDYLKDKLD